MVDEEYSDSRERIMDAVYHALTETGYADLTMSDIAQQSETSTSLLHYHYDTKEDLLVAFLDHIVSRLEAHVEEVAEREATDRLYELLALYVLDPSESERVSFHVALMELRSQAPYNERYQQRFTEADGLLTGTLTEIIQTGIEAELFHPSADPRATALLLLSAVDGARTRGIMLGDSSYTQEVFSALFDNVLDDLFTDEAADRWQELVGE